MEVSFKIGEEEKSKEGEMNCEHKVIPSCIYSL